MRDMVWKEDNQTVVWDDHLKLAHWKSSTGVVFIIWKKKVGKEFTKPMLFCLLVFSAFFNSYPQQDQLPMYRLMWHLLNINV